MTILEKIINFIKPYIANPKKLILILICVFIFQNIFCSFYIRSLKRKIKSQANFEQFPTEQKVFSNVSFTFTSTEIAFILKGLNISTDELCSYHKPQIDSIKTLITKKKKERDGLKARLAKLKTQGSNSLEILELTQKLSLHEEQIKSYQEKASFWEGRSRELKNMVKIFGIDSIISYLTHKDSIERALTELPPQILIVPKKNAKKISLKNETNDMKRLVLNKTPLPSPGWEKNITTPEETKTKIGPKNKFVTFQNQSSNISKDEMIAMLKKYKFFDYYWNNNGRGFKNQFETQNVQGHKVVIDNASRLMWQQGGTAESITYDEAKKYIEELNQKQFASYADWRLPTLKEAMTLVEPVKNDLLFINTLFTMEQNWIWTSDFVEGESGVWVVSFILGGCRSSYSLSFSSYYVRAVRSVNYTSR